MTKDSKDVKTNSANALYIIINKVMDAWNKFKKITISS